METDLYAPMEFTENGLYEFLKQMPEWGKDFCLAVFADKANHRGLGLKEFLMIFDSFGASAGIRKLERLHFIAFGPSPFEVHCEDVPKKTAPRKKKNAPVQQPKELQVPSLSLSQPLCATEFEGVFFVVVPITVNYTRGKATLFFKSEGKELAKFSLHTLAKGSNTSPTTLSLLTPGDMKSKYAGDHVESSWDEHYNGLTRFIHTTFPQAEFHHPFTDRAEREKKKQAKLLKASSSSSSSSSSSPSPSPSSPSSKTNNKKKNNKKKESKGKDLPKRNLQEGLTSSQRTLMSRGVPHYITMYGSRHSMPMAIPVPIIPMPIPMAMPSVVPVYAVSVPLQIQTSSVAAPVAPVGPQAQKSDNPNLPKFDLPDQNPNQLFPLPTPTLIPTLGSRPLTMAMIDEETKTIYRIDDQTRAAILNSHPTLGASLNGIMRVQDGVSQITSFGPPSYEQGFMRSSTPSPSAGQRVHSPMRPLSPSTSSPPLACVSGSSSIPPPLSLSPSSSNGSQDSENVDMSTSYSTIFVDEQGHGQGQGQTTSEGQSRGQVLPDDGSSPPSSSSSFFFSNMADSGEHHQDPPQNYSSSSGSASPSMYSEQISDSDPDFLSQPDDERNRNPFGRISSPVLDDFYRDVLGLRSPPPPPSDL